MHHNPAKNVLWVASTIEDRSRRSSRLDEAATRLLLARAKGKLLAARRERRPVPAIDTTLYVGWNAMFVSAYLEAARVLDREDCRAFALKTLDRILAEAWDENERRFCIASAARASKVRSTIRFSSAARFSTPGKRRSTAATSTTPST